MSEPKVIPVGKDCKIIEVMPEKNGKARLAPGYLAQEVSKKLGCDYYRFDDGEHGLKERACDLIKKKTGDFFAHPLVNGVVKYFAKWKKGEYLLKRGNKIVNMDADRSSPLRVMKELQECVSPKKKR